MSSDYDDLPPEPHKGADDDETAGSAMGRMFSAALWLVPVLGIAGLIGYLLIHAIQR